MTEERIGDKLRKLREEVGLSQRELARRSQVAREHINQIEAHKTKSMMLTTAERLAKGMDIAPCRFFNGDHKEHDDEIIQRLIAHIKKFK